MNIEDFNKTEFTGSMRVTYKDRVRDLFSVNFTESLIGLVEDCTGCDEGDIEWVRCLRNLIHEEGISIPGVKKLLELTPCWDIKDCPVETRENCSAFVDNSSPCWELTSSACARGNNQCEGCEVYVKAMKEARPAAASGE